MITEMQNAAGETKGTVAKFGPLPMNDIMLADHNESCRSFCQIHSANKQFFEIGKD